MINRASTLILAALLALLLGPAAVAGAAAPPAARQSAAALPDAFFWRTGVNLKTWPDYSDLSLRGLNPIVVFRSAQAEANFFLLGAAPRPLQVQALSVYLLSRAGTYAGTAELQLWSADMTGGSQQLMTAGVVDLKTLPAGVWQAVPLVDESHRLVRPGETLLLYLARGAPAGGSLELRLAVEAALTPSVIQVRLPLVIR